MVRWIVLPCTIINPDDLNAVEAALSLKDELGCKVIAFTMGPPPAEGMLRELMAMGVDEGVLPILVRELLVCLGFAFLGKDRLDLLVIDGKV